MTTTLRPTGPEARQDGGGRARSYDVCVNSRRVGGIRLATDERFGPTAGRIEALEIDPADRRRGRATVAALAAEEVLRGWGCRQIELTVPAEAAAAVCLAAALGYTERSRLLSKELGPPPELPDGSRDRTLTEAEFPAWRDAELAAYVPTLMSNGLTREQAERAAAYGPSFLPDGPAGPDHAVRILVRDGVDVGSVWVATRRPGQPGGHVMDVRVDTEHRGRGHGRTLMLVAERVCLAAGLPVLGLNVYAGNAPARRLYDSLGYRPSAYLLWKPIL
ncbi:GNAT family N-acetyltransferase [Streptomyces halobius]|uniref:GNAT family N-acetyltransferase n=1 Tax=Streptomyces halobius TaxID=2879846 RepID=A0ABY4MJ86_9ACTN|nr:GNAT family N-acetyltransferase [Streptomyces halobius]UQA96475.1 GNAT family N-acetyltransferase [Streptomyces halobius]